MAFEETNGNGMYMPVAPAYGGGNNGFGGDGWWIILLLLACGGGWGFGGGFGGGYGNMQLGYDFPWLLNGQNGINNNVNDGFRDQMLQSSIQGLQGSITSGFGDVQTALCGGFAGVNATITGAQNAIAQQMYGNEIASLERSYASQTANMQGFNGVERGISDLRYTEATEACATRNASAQNTRDIIDAQTRGTQAILDKLCTLELDGYKREADNLRQQLNMAQLAASQTAQTAQILAGQTAEIDGVYNRLKNCPVPSMPVYGNTPIFTCSGNNSCGCGNF